MKNKIIDLFSFYDLRKYNHKRAKEWIDSWNLNDRAVELGGETGEALNICKKIRRAETLNDTAEINRLLTKLADELADVIISCDLVAREADINLGKAVIQKFNKTSNKKELDTKIPENKYKDCKKDQG